MIKNPKNKYGRYIPKRKYKMADVTSGRKYVTALGINKENQVTYFTEAAFTFAANDLPNIEQL